MSESADRGKKPAGRKVRRSPAKKKRVAPGSAASEDKPQRRPLKKKAVTGRTRRPSADEESPQPRKKIRRSPASEAGGGAKKSLGKKPVKKRTAPGSKKPLSKEEQLELRKKKALLAKKRQLAQQAEEAAEVSTPSLKKKKTSATPASSASSLGRRAKPGKKAPSSARGKISKKGVAKKRLAKPAPEPEYEDDYYEDDYYEEDYGPRGGRLQKKKSNMPLTIGILAGSLILTCGIVFFVINQDKPPADDSGTQPKNGTEVVKNEEEIAKKKAQEKARLAKEQREQLDKLQKRLQDDREDVLYVLDRVMIAVRNPDIDAEVKAEFLKFSNELKRLKKELAEEKFNEVVAESEKLQKGGQYQLAHQLFKEKPVVVSEENAVNQKWVNAERDSSDYAIKGKYWAMIVEKVREWLQREEPDIALAILDQNITSKDYEVQYEIIWEQRQTLYAEIQQHSGSKIKAIIDLERKQIEEKLAILRKQREEERRQRWKFALEALPWAPLISRNGDLENWTFGPTLNRDKMGQVGVRFNLWEIKEIDDVPVLMADTVEHKVSGFCAQNGNRWQDWALEFEVKVTKGKLTLQTRTMLSRFLSVQSKIADDLEFTDKNSKDWLKVRLYVHGGEIKYYEYQDGDYVEVKALKDDNDRQTGGFRFVLATESICQFRNMNIKIVNQYRRGDDLAKSEFDEEEIDEDDVIDGN